MARKSKWVEVSSPQEPIVEVARRALGDRLLLVWRYLQRSSQGAPTDTENVHQLRVSTRRAVAAMEIFDALLPARRKRWMNKQLHRVRKAAGEARDLDVMLDRFLPVAEAETGDGPYGALVHVLKVRRQRAQEPIDETYEKLDQKRLRRRVRGLVNRVRLRSKQDRFTEPSYADAAQSAVESRLKDFFRASEADFSDYTLLHAFRIEGKHLRYTMEVFASAFEPAFRDELYPLIADLQDRLGKINDHATAKERFGQWFEDADEEDALRPTFESLVAEERQALDVARSEFLDWWTPDRRDDLRKRFADALQMDLAELLPASNASAQAAQEPPIVLRRAE